MANKNRKSEPKEEKVEQPVDGFWKGYDVRWLKKNPDHADFKLVAEYEAEFGEIEL